MLDFVYDLSFTSGNFRAAEGHHEERPWKSTGADSGGFFSSGNWGETSEYLRDFFCFFRLTSAIC